MKITINNNEYDVRNPKGVEYIRSVFLATMKQRHKDEARIESIVIGLTRGDIPKRGAHGGEGLGAERTAILRGFLKSAGIEAELRSKEGKSAALEALAKHLNKTVEDLEADLSARAEKMKELATV